MSRYLLAEMRLKRYIRFSCLPTNWKLRSHLLHSVKQPLAFVVIHTSASRPASRFLSPSQPTTTPPCPTTVPRLHISSAKAFKQPIPRYIALVRTIVNRGRERNQRTSFELSTSMVCAKCQKLSTTKLVTPEVKKKSEIYYGSPASSSSSKGTGTKSATLGNAGVTKVRSTQPPLNNRAASH